MDIWEHPTTQGQLSAVGTIVSAGYGFICGAYMPISNFGSGLQKALSYLPSTYATSLIRIICFTEFSERWRESIIRMKWLKR